MKNKFNNKYDADVIIIGSGAAGSIAANTNAEHGLKSIVIEQDKFGGDCLNYSCIPTKALLQTSYVAKTIKSAKKYGFKDVSPKLNFEDAKHWAKKAVNASGAENLNQQSNVASIKGHAHFIDPYTVSVGLKRLRAKKFVLANGSSTIVPNIDGLEDVGYITYKDVLNLKKLPKTIAIIGGGSVGYEYSQIFESFGSKVHLFESKDHLLPDQDTEVGDLAETILSSDGVRVHTLSKVTAVKKASKSIVVEHKNHGQTHKISVDAIMLACGSEPNTDIGLENALVNYTEEGIRVNSQLQTSQKHIFAAGDVTGIVSNTGASIKQGQIVAHNIVHRKKISYSHYKVPHVTFGYPEIATVGLTERAMNLTGRPFQTSIAPIGLVGKSYTTDYQAGFVKIVASHTGNLLGASVVAPYAGEIISELTVAIQHSRKACDISNVVHPFSTWSEAVRIAASKIYCI